VVEPVDAAASHGDRRLPGVLHPLFAPLVGPPVAERRRLLAGTLRLDAVVDARGLAVAAHERHGYGGAALRSAGHGLRRRNRDPDAHLPRLAVIPRVIRNGTDRHAARRRRRTVETAGPVGGGSRLAGTFENDCPSEQ